MTGDEIHPAQAHRPARTRRRRRSGPRRPPDQGADQASASPVTSPSSTTWTSTACPPRRSSRASRPRCSTPRARRPAATRTSVRRSSSTRASRSIDDLGADVMAIAEGHRLRIVDGSVYDGDDARRRGRRADRRDRRAAMEEARAGLSVQLESFAANTMDYLRRERDLLLDGVGVPGHLDRDRRPAGADRRARLPLQGRPGHAAPVHPGVPTGAHRGGRRRGRDPRRRAGSPT